MKTVIQNKLKKRYFPMKELKTLLKNTIETTLKTEPLDLPTLVSILLVENDEILRINSEFRDKDSVTDVLSFPMLSMKNGSFIEQPGTMDMDNGRVILGDIVISVPKAIEQAKTYGHEPYRELAFLAAHGLLHLLGYDHIQQDEEIIMIDRQKQIMSDMGL